MFKGLLDRMFGSSKGARIQLAAAYIDMGDKAAAKKVLVKLIADGTPEEKAQAQILLLRIS